jgi:hypothetical protein
MLGSHRVGIFRVEYLSSDQSRVFPSITGSSYPFLDSLHSVRSAPKSDSIGGEYIRHVMWCSIVFTVSLMYTSFVINDASFGSILKIFFQYDI